MLVVTGGHGFIGSNLLMRLAESSKEQVLTIDKEPPGPHLRSIYASKEFSYQTFDLKESHKLLQLFKSLQGDVSVLHLAANSDIKNGALDCKPDFEDTLVTTISLVEALRYSDLSVRKFYFSSSSAVFGIRSSSLPSLDDQPKLPISAYGWSKLASEYVIREYCHSKGVQVGILRFPNVVGPFQTHGFLFDLERKLRINPSHVNILGNGYQTKPYIHVEDLAKIVIWIMYKHDKNITINIGPTDQISIRAILEQYIKTKNLKLSISYEDSASGWPGDVPCYQMGSDEVLMRICKDMNIELDSSDAISRAINWLTK